LEVSNVRNWRYLLYGGLGAVALLIVAGTGLSQFRSGGDSRSGGFRGSSGGTPGGMPGGTPGGMPGGMPSMGGSSSRGGMDPSFMFNRYANGGDVIVISQVRSSFFPQLQEWMTQYAQRNGISSGQLTREQFAGFYQDVLSQQMANRGSFRGGPPSGAPTGVPSGSPTGTVGNTDSFDEERARQRFRERDHNGDGVLSPDEASDTLRAEFSQWDANHNGVIEWDEYKEYYKARNSYMRDQYGQGGGYNPNNPMQPGDPNFPIPEEDRKPTVYRSGNLPKELPPWFAQMDRDRDGQIGLYEWKDAGRTTVEFREIDANQDGFITVEEALRSVKRQALVKNTMPQPGGIQTANAGFDPTSVFGAGSPTSGEKKPEAGKDESKKDDKGSSGGFRGFSGKGSSRGGSTGGSSGGFRPPSRP